MIGALLLPVLAARFGRYRMLLVSFVLLPGGARALRRWRPTPARPPSRSSAVGATYMFVFSGIGTVVQLRAPADAAGPGPELLLPRPRRAVPDRRPAAGPDRRPHRPRPGDAASGLALLLVVGLLRVFRPERLAALDDPHDPVRPAADPLAFEEQTTGGEGT